MISREHIGARVIFDVTPYPEGYAWGAEPTGETARGIVHTVEGDAGIGWAFVRIDPADRGEGGEFRHVPMDRIQVIDRPDVGDRVRVNHPELTAPAEGTVYYSRPVAEGSPYFSLSADDGRQLGGPFKIGEWEIIS